MKNRYPTQEELYALRLEARRMRAAEMRRLALAAVNAVRGLFRFKVKELRHA